MNETTVRREYMSVSEACRAHGYAVGGTALRYAARMGQIDAVKIGGRYLLKRDSVQAYVERARARTSNRPLGARAAASAVS